MSLARDQFEDDLRLGETYSVEERRSQYGERWQSYCWHGRQRHYCWACRKPQGSVAR